MFGADQVQLGLIVVDLFHGPSIHQERRASLVPMLQVRMLVHIKLATRKLET